MEILNREGLKYDVDDAADRSHDSSRHRLLGGQDILNSGYLHVQLEESFRATAAKCVNLFSLPRNLI